MKKEKKVADNVVNAWYCREGQAVGSECILFLKEDGTCMELKTLEDLTEENEDKEDIED